MRLGRRAAQKCGIIMVPTSVMEDDVATKLFTDVCAIEGCVEPRGNGGRNSRSSLCVGHRNRKTRNGGDVQADIPLKPHRKAGTGTIHFGRVMDTLPLHPIAPPNGHVARHRVILYDAIGPGAHSCHWCANPVAWEDPFPLGLEVDHIDGDSLNNDLSNLTPSCRRCNIRRAHAGNPQEWAP